MSRFFSALRRLAGIILILLLVVVFTYKAIKPETGGQDEAALAYQGSEDSENEAVIPTGAVVKVTQAPIDVENEEEDSVYIADASEVINSKPVTTEKENLDADENEVTPTPAVQEKSDPKRPDKTSNSSSKQSKAASSSTSKSSEEKERGKGH